MSNLPITRAMLHIIRIRNQNGDQITQKYRKQKKIRKKGIFTVCRVSRNHPCTQVPIYILTLPSPLMLLPLIKNRFLRPVPAIIRISVTPASVRSRRGLLVMIIPC